LNGQIYYDLWIGKLFFYGDCQSWITNFNLAPEIFRVKAFKQLIVNYNPWNAPEIPICPEVATFYCRLGTIRCFVVDYGQYQLPSDEIIVGTIIGICPTVLESSWKCWEYYEICWEYIEGGDAILHFYPNISIPYPDGLPNCPNGCTQSCG